MRSRISRNQANGSIFASSHDVTKLRRTAAVFPPLSLPKNVQLFRLCSSEHKRNYVQATNMCSSPLPVAA